MRINRTGVETTDRISHHFRLLRNQFREGLSCQFRLRQNASEWFLHSTHNFRTNAYVNEELLKEMLTMESLSDRDREQTWKNLFQSRRLEY